MPWHLRDKTIGIYTYKQYMCTWRQQRRQRRQTTTVEMSDAWMARVNTCHTSYQRRCMHTMPKPTYKVPDISSSNIFRTHTKDLTETDYMAIDLMHSAHVFVFFRHSTNTNTSDRQSDTNQMKKKKKKKTMWRQLSLCDKFGKIVDKIKLCSVCSINAYVTNMNMNIFLILWRCKRI